MTKTPQEARTEETDFHESYTEYAKTLRAWLVAYGVGGPVLFLTQPGIADRIKDSSQGALIVYLFLTGVASQVLIALVNKWVNWYFYSKANPNSKRNATIYKALDRLSESFWIDILADLVSLGAVGLATAKVLLLFT